ncbi:hypothetical protein GCM10009836_24920 [Pseudonocardia ailaonensis]|uniref:Uncharacterized protein n=1 Tax=Pseudonocardia ailaonensis TaxID=367279 RepID=A0ABN2MZ71_9PSEU
MGSRKKERLADVIVCGVLGFGGEEARGHGQDPHDLDLEAPRGVSRSVGTVRCDDIRGPVVLPKLDDYVNSESSVVYSAQWRSGSVPSSWSVLGRRPDVWADLTFSSEGGFLRGRLPVPWSPPQEVGTGRPDGVSAVRGDPVIDLG